MAKKNKNNQVENETVEAAELNASNFKGYSITWLKKLRAEGEPHPTADHLVDEFDALTSPEGGNGLPPEEVPGVEESSENK